MFYNPRNGSILCCRSGKISARCACQPLPAPEVDPEAIGGTVFIGQTNVGYECLTVGNCGDKGTLLSWGARFVTDDEELEDAMFFDPEVPHEGEVLEEGPDIVCRPHVGIDPQYFMTPGLKTGKVEIYERVLSGVPSAFCDVEVTVVPRYTGPLWVRDTFSYGGNNYSIAYYAPSAGEDGGRVWTWMEDWGNCLRLKVTDAGVATLRRGIVQTYPIYVVHWGDWVSVDASLDDDGAPLGSYAGNPPPPSYGYAFTSTLIEWQQGAFT